MRPNLHCFVIAAALLSACAGPPPPAPAAQPEGLKVQLVVAREVRQGSGPLGVGDRFRIDGHMVGYASLTWTDIGTPWGAQTFEWRWFSGERLVKRGTVQAKVGKPPHYVWSVTQPVALGPGKGHVEFVWNEQVLARRSFEIIDPSVAPDVPPPGRQPVSFR